VFVKIGFDLEHKFARSAKVVTFVEVFIQFITIIEMLLATSTIEVSITVNPVLLQTLRRREITFAGITNVMHVRVALMLLQSATMGKVALATITINHRDERKIIDLEGGLRCL